MKINWKLPNTQIAQQLAVSYSKVRNMKIAKGIKQNPRGNRSLTLPPATWKAMDWSRSNREIADILGCCILTVFRKRKAMGIKSFPVGRNWAKA